MYIARGCLLCYSNRGACGFTLQTSFIVATIEAAERTMIGDVIKLYGSSSAIFIIKSHHRKIA